MDAQEVRIRIGTAQAELDDTFMALAGRYRRDVLIPLCRRLHLTYASGTGNYAFFDEDGAVFSDNPWSSGFRHGYEQKLTKEDLQLFQDVRVALDLAINTHNSFGECIENIEKEDWE